MCLDTVVGDKNKIKGISGGEKKRTSIAFELINNPSVIILDEPTSGLDSLTAFIIINYLHRLAKEHKRTILMTIHQPNAEIFNKFDKLILLSEGQIIYQGNPRQSVAYFSELGLNCPKFSNPPDYFISIIHAGS